jgi:hypothetical protein
MMMERCSNVQENYPIPSLPLIQTNNRDAPPMEELCPLTYHSWSKPGMLDRITSFLFLLGTASHPLENL